MQRCASCGEGAWRGKSEKLKTCEPEQGPGTSYRFMQVPTFSRLQEANRDAKFPTGLQIGIVQRLEDVERVNPRLRNSTIAVRLLQRIL